MSTPPAPVDLMTVGGTLRFGVGVPDGRRSSTWRVQANHGSRDVYIGPRGAFGIIKLSLHQSGRWRLAYTDAGARKLRINGDRIIHRYDVTRESAPGWRLATVIRVPESSLSLRANPEQGKVQWWPEPGTGFALDFQVWITSSRDADVRGHTIIAAGCAGSFFLAGGGSVFVMVDEPNIDRKTFKIESARRQSYEFNRARGLKTDDDFFSFGSGGDENIDVPILVDLGNLDQLRLDN